MNSEDSRNPNMEDPIDGMIDTPVGRKIMRHRLKATKQDNDRMRRKIAEMRIAVCALNELTIILSKIANRSCRILNENHIPMDDESKALFSRARRFQVENFGTTMTERIDEILIDTEGDEILERNLYGGKRNA